MTLGSTWRNVGRVTPYAPDGSTGVRVWLCARDLAMWAPEGEYSEHSQATLLGRLAGERVFGLLRRAARVFLEVRRSVEECVANRQAAPLISRSPRAPRASRPQGPYRPSGGARFWREASVCAASRSTMVDAQGAELNRTHRPESHTRPVVLSFCYRPYLRAREPRSYRSYRYRRAGDPACRSEHLAQNLIPYTTHARFYVLIDNLLT